MSYKKDVLNKALAVGVMIVFLTTVFLPVGNSVVQKSSKSTFKNGAMDYNIKIRMLDCTRGNVIVSEKTVSLEKWKEILSILEESNGLDERNFYQKMVDKIEMLRENDIISAETTSTLKRFFLAKQVSVEKLQHGTTRFFDVLNVFNGIFFGLRGVKEFSILELPVFVFPFFDGNITAQFSVLGKFSGNGSVFTLGTLGFRYIYDFNMSKYDFPYFPTIRGTVIGFSGILAEVKSFIGEGEGPFVFGVGMTIFTMWNKV